MEALLTYPNSVVEEAELNAIRKAQKDPKAFEPLYNKYYRKIFLFVLHKVNDKAIAADITSQVFLKALLKINDYVFKGLPFSSWLYRVAINEINGFFRINRKYKHVVFDQALIEILQDQVEMSAEETNYLNEHLSQIIESLTKEEMELIDLRFFEALSFKEVGDVLEITENNAKVKLYRLLEKLRQKFPKK